MVTFGVVDALRAAKALLMEHFTTGATARRCDGCEIGPCDIGAASWDGEGALEKVVGKKSRVYYLAYAAITRSAMALFSEACIEDLGDREGQVAVISCYEEALERREHIKVIYQRKAA